MKILLVTPVHPRLPQTQPLPLWQPQNFWRRALVREGHVVKVFLLVHPRLKLVNSFRLNQLIHSWQPQEIFFSAGADTVLPINQTVFFTGVPLNWLSRDEQQTALKSKLVVTNDSHNAPQAICLPISAIDDRLHRPVKPVPKYLSDVCFIGGLLPQRQKLFKQLLNQGFSLRLYGHLPGKTVLDPQLKSVYDGEVWGKDLVKVYSSAKIALNLVPSHLPSGGNLRTFEIAGCRAFQLTSQINPDWFAPGQEVVIYHHPQDLVQKIRYYLSHPLIRHRIANAGYNRAHHDHTYQQRFALLIKKINHYT